MGTTLYAFGKQASSFPFFSFPFLLSLSTGNDLLLTLNENWRAGT